MSRVGHVERCRCPTILPWKNDETWSGRRGAAASTRRADRFILRDSIVYGRQRRSEERGGSGTDEGVPGPMFDAIKSGSRVNRLLSLSLLLSRIVRKSFVLYIRAYEKPFIENRFWYRC